MAFELETDRLALRDLASEDLDAMIAAWTDPDVARLMDDWGPRTATATAAWLDAAMEARRADPTGYGCSIVTKDDGVVVGWIGFGRSSRGVADMDFAYVIISAYRGKGYASEALRGVIRYCFDEIGVSSFWGECHVDNTPSARAMEAAGMREIGVVDGQRRFIVGQMQR
ncbi:MAG TPA: GNAT family N-acetyltransferase [Acidimicrobiales bacterium]|nr:GNAT family N-acetyltransferase [Acidimicrobiales bacterium]